MRPDTPGEKKSLLRALVLLAILALVVFSIFGVASAKKPTDGNTGQPSSPPCDADHGHPEQNVGRCPQDSDGDGVPDAEDNCPNVSNEDQTNTDANLPAGDAAGDACDNDDDADGLADSSEAPNNCDPLDGDTDDDGLTDGTEVNIGTLCNDADTDDDGVNDGADDCPVTPGTLANGCPDTSGGEETSCDEDGLEILKDTPAEGVASAYVHEPGEDVAELVGLGEELHQLNCDAVVPTEDAIDELLAGLGIPPSP